MKRWVWILLISIVGVCLIGFVYTFVQPRYSAEVLAVGRSKSVTRHTKHGTRSSSYLPLTVRLTDGAETTEEVRWPLPGDGVEAGQRITVIRTFNGYAPYPFTGLRLFTGSVGGALGFFLLLMVLNRKKKKTDSRAETRGKPAEEDAQRNPPRE